MREKLNDLLTQTLPSREEPKLLMMWEMFKRQTKSASSKPKEQKNDDYKKLQNEYQKIEKDYDSVLEERDLTKAKLIETQSTLSLVAKDIMKICKELSKALRGQREICEEDLTNIEQQIEKYESLFNINDAPYTERPDLEIQSKPPSNELELKLKSPCFGPQPKAEEIKTDLPFLDYKKIKSFLASPSSDDLKICALLQALRWRVIRCHRKSEKNKIIVDYVKSDFLGCISNPSLLRNLLKNENPK